MALMEKYLIKTSDIDEFFNAVISAQAPESFGYKFLEGLGFKSSNDRLWTGVLKGLGFLDDAAKPTERYFRFLDQGNSKRVLAEAIKESYGDLFRINRNAQELDASQVEGKLKTLTEGQKSAVVIKNMTSTFRALCEYADWTGVESKTSDESSKNDESKEKPPEEMSKQENKKAITRERSLSLSSGGLHYNIQIHLPESRDQAVYDALFRSLRAHLLWSEDNE